MFVVQKASFYEFDWASANIAILRADNSSQYLLICSHASLKTSEAHCFHLRFICPFYPSLPLFKMPVMMKPFTIVIQALGHTLLIHNTLYLHFLCFENKAHVKFYYLDRFIRGLIIFIILFSAGIAMNATSFIKANHHG